MKNITKLFIFLISAVFFLVIVLATAWVIFQVVSPWQLSFWWSFWAAILLYLVLIAIRAIFKE